MLVLQLAQNKGCHSWKLKIEMQLQTETYTIWDWFVEWTITLIKWVLKNINEIKKFVAQIRIKWISASFYGKNLNSQRMLSAFKSNTLSVFRAFYESLSFVSTHRNGIGQREFVWNLGRWTFSDSIGMDRYCV